MAKKVFPIALMALMAGLLVVACDDDTTTDDPVGPGPVVEENVAPEFTISTVAALSQEDTTLWVGTEYMRQIMATDENGGPLTYALT
ncbi:MAG: hypothetical protein GF331_11740, partial [Chitinivibrionales bacterium]|nr:hypothetical protein [Chitinivibrionales bacterium]